MTTLDAINKRQKELLQKREAMLAVLAKHSEKSQEGKVVGLVIPEAMRKRLQAASERYGAHSYRQICMVALELGLDAMEQK